MEIDTSNGFVVWTGKNRWIFGAFRGNFNIAYRPEGCKGKPDFGQGFTRPKYNIIKNEIAAIIKAPPESKRPIVFSKYVPEEKKYLTDFVITFVKDDSMIYHMDVNFKDGGVERSERCTFMSPGGISIGSEPMSKNERSSASMESFYEWMEREAPVMFALSREKWTPPANNNSSNSDKDTSDFFG